jgi:hypothetical protein
MADELARGGSTLRFLGPRSLKTGYTKKGFVTDWSTSIEQDGKALVTPKDRIEN